MEWLPRNRNRNRAMRASAGRGDAFAANSGSQVLRRPCIRKAASLLGLDTFVAHSTSTASAPRVNWTALNYGFSTPRLNPTLQKIAKNGTLILCAAMQGSARRPCTFGRQHKPRPAWPVEWSPLLRTRALRCCGGPAFLRNRSHVRRLRPPEFKALATRL